MAMLDGKIESIFRGEYMTGPLQGDKFIRLTCKGRTFFTDNALLMEKIEKLEVLDKYCYIAYNMFVAKAKPNYYLLTGISLQ